MYRKRSDRSLVFRGAESAVVAVAAGVMALGTGLVPAQAASSSTDSVPPTVPANLQAVSVDDHDVTLRWSPSTDPVWDHTIDGDNPFVGYRVYLGDTFLNLAGSNSPDQTTLTITEGRLPADRDLTLSVEAYDRQDNRSGRASVTVHTAKDTTPPLSPRVFAGALGAPSVQVSWDKVPDADHIDYVISGSVNTVVTDTSWSGTRLTVPAVEAGTYTYTVQARDASGNLSAPRTASIDIERTSPSAPANLHQVGGTPGFPDEIAWDAATDDSGKPIDYTVFIDDFSFVQSTFTTSARVSDLINAFWAQTGILPTFSPGIHDLTVQTTDSSGNTSPRSEPIPYTVN